MNVLMDGITLFQKGGAVMYVLLACSLLVVYIGVERALFFRRLDSGAAFSGAFYTAMKTRQYDKARQLAAASAGGLALILRDALAMAETGRADAYVETQSGILLSRLRRHLYYLNVIVTMAPLLGLLGTISGMITSFSVFNVSSGQASAITGGVGEALVATAFGLCVAILSLAVHAYFTQWLDRIITDMELCFSALDFTKGRQQGA